MSCDAVSHWLTPHVPFGKDVPMSFLEWFLAVALGALYIVCLFTVCGLTFSKGHTWLGVFGILLPVLWLVGAILPAREGSRYAIAEASRYRQQAVDYSR